MYRCRAARAAARRHAAAVYRKMFDAGSGFPYYYHTVTGASCWTLPAFVVRLLDPDDLEMTPRSVAAALAAYPPTGAV